MSSIIGPYPPEVIREAKQFADTARITADIMASPPALLTIGQVQLTDKILRVVMAEAFHSAVQEDVTELLLDMACSKIEAERLFAAKHKATPLAQVVMMIGDDSPDVRRAAQAVVEANSK